MVKITIEHDGTIECPYCGLEIASNEREEEHGVCEHLICVHLFSFSDEDNPDFSKDETFAEWWRNQNFEDLCEERDDDPDSTSAFGYKELNPKVVRVLKSYETCPYIDCLVAQEDQGGGPSCGAIGPVLIGFRENPKTSIEETS